MTQSQSRSYLLDHLFLFLIQLRFREHGRGGLTFACGLCGGCCGCRGGLTLSRCVPQGVVSCLSLAPIRWWGSNTTFAPCLHPFGRQSHYQRHSGAIRGLLWMGSKVSSRQQGLHNTVSGGVSVQTKFPTYSQVTSPVTYHITRHECILLSTDLLGCRLYLAET